MKVFSLGYQGLGLEQYTTTLLDAGVGIVLDVRETPWSYNRKYIRSVMERALAEVGIEYRHLKECGNPSANRKTATSPQDCLAKYKIYLDENAECLDTLFECIEAANNGGKPACLTCFEHEPQDCHRSILLDKLSDIQPALFIDHLVVEKEVPIKRVDPRQLSLDTTALQL